jgi:hypothetical protein
VTRTRRAVVRQQPAFGFRTIERTRTVQRAQPTQTVVYGLPVASPVMVQETVQIPKTVEVQREIEVPVTRMEKRIVTEQQTVYETATVERLVCPQPVWYQPARVEYVTAPVQVKQTTRRRVRSWYPGKLLSRILPTRTRVRSRASYVYQPPGENLFGHLQNTHGVSTAGMSYSQALALHTSLH